MSGADGDDTLEFNFICLSIQFKQYLVNWYFIPLMDPPYFLYWTFTFLEDLLSVWTKQLHLQIKQMENRLLFTSCHIYKKIEIFGFLIFSPHVVGLSLSLSCLSYSCWSVSFCIVWHFCSVYYNSYNLSFCFSIFLW